MPAVPQVLVLHAKRFEHSGGARAVARKLETDLSFPLTDLDMRPFLSAAVLRSRWVGGWRGAVCPTVAWG